MNIFNSRNIIYRSNA